MSKKIYVITQEPGEENISFIIKEKKDDDSEGFELKRSSSQVWSSHVRGEIVGEIKDNGNDITLTLDGKKYKLGYDDIFELKIMIDFYYSKCVQIPIKFMKEI
jgi:hypothetical protein